jgi:chromosome segregation ATPase
MKAQLERRLAELRAEFEKGQEALAGLDAQRDNLRQTLLRISGAIQVLEEELSRSEEAVSENGKSGS